MTMEEEVIRLKKAVEDGVKLISDAAVIINKQEALINKMKRIDTEKDQLLNDYAALAARQSAELAKHYAAKLGV
jgi:hypothetical protein